MGFQNFTNWDLFQDIDSIERYEKWIVLLTDLLNEPIEDYLQPYEWDSLFETWNSSKETADWIKRANSHTRQLKILPDELNQINNRLQKADQNIDAQREKLVKLDSLGMLNQTFQLLKPGLNHTKDMLNMKARSFNGFPRPWLGLQESNIREIKVILGNLFLIRFGANL